jgi:UDP-N-acetylglucosamine 2-epimerase (non-hydrolysing)
MTIHKHKNIACIIGTRPEIIKMAPVIWELKKHPHIKVSLINTAQHRSLVDSMLHLFDLHPDIDMNIMQDNQSLDKLIGNLFLKIGELMRHHHYDFIFSQGDTTTVLVSAQLAFYNRIPFGHIEAGLRTHDFYNPFPEEMNRVMISKLATLHFAPTEHEKRLLIKEGIPANAIFVTGNTVIDSLYYWAEKKAPLSFELPKDKRIILLTLHRRESFGKPLQDMYAAILQIVTQCSDVHVVYPVHPNPNVNDLAHKMLHGHPSITLLKPLPYDEFVSLLSQAYLVMTDSGGLQEEAPALNKPLLILREQTERPLIIELGLAKLAGTKKESIVTAATELLNNPHLYQDMQKHLSPYGDGRAAERMVNIVVNQYLKHR